MRIGYRADVGTRFDEEVEFFYDAPCSRPEDNDFYDETDEEDLCECPYCHCRLPSRGGGPCEDC